MPVLMRPLPYVIYGDNLTAQCHAYGQIRMRSKGRHFGTHKGQVAGHVGALFGAQRAQK